MDFANLQTAFISSGKVLQHPPMSFAPLSYQRFAYFVKSASSPLQVFVTGSYFSPVLGYTATGLSVAFFISQINDSMYSGFVQFTPIA